MVPEIAMIPFFSKIQVLSGTYLGHHLDHVVACDARMFASSSRPLGSMDRRPSPVLGSARQCPALHPFAPATSRKSTEQKSSAPKSISIHSYRLIDIGVIALWLFLSPSPSRRKATGE